MVDAKAIRFRSVYLPHRASHNDGGEHDLSFTVPITKGNHDIRVDNSGNDWFSVDSYELTTWNNARP